MRSEYGIAIWKQGETATIENTTNKEFVSYSLDEGDSEGQFLLEHFLNAINFKGYTIEREEVMQNGERHFHLLKVVNDD